MSPHQRLLRTLADEQAALRIRAAELAAISEPDAEQRAEMDALPTRSADIERRMLAARTAHDAEEQASTVGDDRGGGGGGRELRALIGRVRLGRYLASVAGGERLDGAERELREHRGLPEDEVPWDALLPPEAEARADVATVAPSTVHTDQRPIIGRVFARSATAMLCDMQSVGVGDQVYPVLSAGHGPAWKSAGAAHESTAATISVTTLSPVRLTARYTLRLEDLARVRGLEAALRSDMTMALADKLDSSVIQGGSAPDQTGILSALTDPTDPTTTVTFSSAVASVAGAVDGKYAHSESDLSLLIGPKTYEKFASTFQSSDSPVSLSAYFKNVLGAYRASANIPAAASNIQDAIVRLRGHSSGPDAVCAMWPGMKVIRDVYSGAGSGLVHLTLVALYCFKVLRNDAYRFLEFKLA